MKDLRTFEIDIIALKLGSHSFTFKLDNKFFAYVKEHLNGFIENGDCNTEVILEKNEQLIRATFIIEGTIELVCDRSLDLFDYEIDSEDTILYKYSEQEQELTEEIVLITRRTPSINVGELLYEFLMLDIPMKKLHPRFWDEDESEGDYSESDDFEHLDDESSDKKAPKINFIYSSEEIENKTEDKSKENSEDNKNSKNKTASSSEDQKIDPRWNILKNLKNNQN